MKQVLVVYYVLQNDKAKVEFEMLLGELDHKKFSDNLVFIVSQIGPADIQEKVRCFPGDNLFVISNLFQTASTGPDNEFSRWFDDNNTEFDNAILKLFLRM